MAFINYNGKIQEETEIRLPTCNSAFRYGYGLIETMLVKNGIIRLAHYHWQRLFEGMTRLGFAAPAHLSPERLESEVMRTVKKNRFSALCRVRLEVFADSAGLFDIKDTDTLFLIECYPLEEHIITLNENGLLCGIASGVHKSTDIYANLKSTNMLPYAMAAKEAKRRKWNDALILNHRGNIIESTIANVFWIKDGLIHTPPLSEGCIAGVMRRHILSSTRDQFPIKETVLTPEVLSVADEVFLTNAIRGIKWIKEIGAHKYANYILRKIYSLSMS